MPSYPVTDKQTGDRWIIDAETPERAKEVASLRRAAKQGNIQYESQAEEPSLLGFLKESVEAPYKGEPEDLPGFLGSLGRTYSEGGKVAARSLTPPFLREKFFPDSEPEAADALKVIGMFPPVAAMQAVSDVAGKTARGFGASPLTAGIISQITGAAYPSAMSQITGSRATSAAAKAAKEAEEITARQAPTLKLAERLQGERQAAKGAEQFATGTEQTEARALETAQKSATSATEGTKEFAQMTAGEAKAAVQELQQFPEVARQVAEAAKKRIAANPVSQFKFGEQFKGPDFAQAGEAKGYYRESESIKRAEAGNLYNEARAAAKDVPLPAESILQPIIEDLQAEGVAVKILPTKAERTGMRTVSELDPLTEEQRTYGTVLERLTPEQRQALRAGSTGGTVPRDVYKALFQDLLPETKSGFTAPSSKAIAQRENEVLRAIDTMTLPEHLTVNEAMTLHSRFNGAIRAAEKSKDFALSRQFRRYKSSVDTAIEKASPDAFSKLGAADLFYAKDYAPYFSPGSKLFKINQQRAASIVDSLVSKTDPKLTQQALSVLSDEAKDSLRGAWIQRVFEKSLDDFKGTFSPEKLAKEYRSYLPEVRKTILGEDAKVVDQIVDGFAERVKELQQIARDKAARTRSATETAARTEKEGKAVVSQVQKAGKESVAEAKNLSKQAQAAYDLTADSLARQTVEIAKEAAKANQPQTFRILGFSSLQVQAALGILDVLEYMGGAGGRRYLLFAGRHAIVYYLAQHPEMLGKITSAGKGTLGIVNRVINGNPLSPHYIRDARAFFLLAQQAEMSRDHEQAQ